MGDSMFKKKINVKKLQFYEEIWENVEYLDGFCRFSISFVFGTA